MLLIPAALAVLITIHLAMIMRQHHSQFPGPRPTRAQRRRHADVAGLRAALDRAAVRGGGACCSCSAGSSRSTRSGSGGPYHPYLSENGAQPDWYIGWLIGALRLMPNWELGDRRSHRDPQPVLGRRGVPAVRVRRAVRLAGDRAPLTGDHRRHDLLDRPRDRPIRTAIGAALPQLGRDHLRRRLDRPDLLPPGHLLHRRRSTSGAPASG